MQAKQQNGVHLQDVAQVALTVLDWAEAKAFYRDVLGLTFLFEAGSMAFFQCGSVRLMIAEGEKLPGADGTIIYFRVADLDATARLLALRGVSFVQQPHLVARMKSHNLWMAFIKDPAGNTLGLMSEAGRTNRMEGTNAEN